MILEMLVYSPFNDLTQLLADIILYSNCFLMKRREMILEMLVYSPFNDLMQLLADIILYSNCCRVYGYRFTSLNSTIKEYCFKAYCLLGCCVMYSGKKFIEVLEVAHFSERKAHFFLTAEGCIAEGRNLHIHGCVDLRYYRYVIYS